VLLFSAAEICEILPSAHFVQFEEPVFSANVPRRHGKQNALPGFDWYHPDGQLEQVVAVIFCSLNLPGRQLLHWKSVLNGAEMVGL